MTPAQVTGVIATQRRPRPRMRGTYTRTEGVRHRLAAYELGEDKLDGHIKPGKSRTRFPGFCRYLRSLYPPEVRIAIICDNFSPHRTTGRDSRVGARPAAVKPDRGPVHRPAYFALNGTDHASHEEQASMIRRYIIWRNNHAYHERLRQIVNRANVA